jgi:hypothetical protein
MDHIPKCPCVRAFANVGISCIQLRDRVAHALEGFILEAGANKGRDLRLEVRCIRPGYSRDRPRDVVWLDFMAPHRQLVVDMTVTSACTNTSVSQIGARLLLLGNLALGYERGKPDADLRTSAVLGTPSVKLVHDYNPFALKHGGRLAHMAAEWADCLAILVEAYRFHGMGVADFRFLCYDSYVRMQHFVRRYTYVPFRRCLGDMRRQFVHRLSAARHDASGSHLRDALQAGCGLCRCCGMPSCSSGLGMRGAFLVICPFSLVVISTDFLVKKITKFIYTPPQKSGHALC